MVSLTRLVAGLFLACIAAGCPPAAQLVSAAGTGWVVVAPVRMPPILYWPAGVRVDDQGRMYIADADARAVVVLSPKGKPLRQWTKAGAHPLDNPRTLAIDNSRRLYVADAATGTIVSFTTSGRFLTSWRVVFRMPSFVHGFPVAVDEQGTVWAAAGLRIQAFSPSGRRLRGWETEIHARINYRFPCVMSVGMCLGDITVAPLGITVHAGHVFVLLQALTCGGGGKGTCRSYYYVQAWTVTGRFQWERLAGTRVPGFGFSNPGGLAVDRTGDLLVPVGPDLVALSPTIGKIASLPWTAPPWPDRPPGFYGSPDITGVTVDARGRIYLTLGQMHVLQRLSPRGRPEATWGNQVSDTFSRPRGIAVDRSGVMYLGDTNDSAVKKLAPSGLTVAAWKTAGYPQAVALDRAGKVYVSSVKGATSTLQVISSDGSVLCQWPLPGRAGSTLGSGPGSLTVDSAGDVYVAELDAMRVVKFSADGAVLATWQEQPGAPIQDYLHPTALTLDAHDDLWVAFTVPDRIVEYSPRGSELTSWPLPLLHRGAVSDPATGLTFDPAGHLWAVAPEEVVELSTGGQVLRSWSKWGTTPGTFISPSGIASDAVGAIYVVDSWNDWVQKLIL